MYIRSQDKSVVVQFTGGVVYQEESCVTYCLSDGTEFDLAEYDSEESAAAVLEIFYNSLQNDFFDFSQYTT
jgi:hypothetical protein